MKQLLFLGKTTSKSLYVKANTLADVAFPVEDIISPQKTDFVIQRIENVENGDVIVVFEDDISQAEYIGIVETVVTTTTTRVSCYPLIMVFDNDLVLDQMYQQTTNRNKDTVDGPVNVTKWLETQMIRSFVDTEDVYQFLPLEIVHATISPSFLKKVIDTSNLYDVYTSIFVDTGVYIRFSGLKIEGGTIKIVCEFHNNREEETYLLFYDNPTLAHVEITDKTFEGINKIIVTEELAEESQETPRRFYFYLLKDNSITIDHAHEKRIKQVKSKEITFNFGEYLTDAEAIKALLVVVHNELQAPEYNLKIELTMLNNDKLTMCRKVKYTHEDGTTYYSNITKIEKIGDNQVKVTLGALRNSLVDFKKRLEDI